MRKIRLFRHAHAEFCFRNRFDPLRVLELRDLDREPFVFLFDAIRLTLHLDERIAAARADAAADGDEHRERRDDEEERLAV